MKNTSNFLKIGVCLVLILVGDRMSTCQAETSMTFDIGLTWNGLPVTKGEVVTITFSSAQAPQQGLAINISAPFYNDPLPPPIPRRLDGLSAFEVVDIFFLGPRQKYLEVELGPGGNYFILYLMGIRNVIDANWTLTDYNVSINEGSKRWTGSAVIPTEYFPPLVDKFSAYASHGSKENRTVLALFPPEGDATTTEPDLHELECFKKIDLSNFIEIRDPPIITTRSSSASSIVSCLVASALLMFIPLFF